MKFGRTPLRVFVPSWLNSLPMAWLTENRRTATFERRAEPYLTDEIKRELADKYFPRYPTKRAVLLPALHHVQHVYNWIPPQAMEEIAAFLELAPAEVMDTEIGRASCR